MQGEGMPSPLTICCMSKTFNNNDVLHRKMMYSNNNILRVELKQQSSLIRITETIPFHRRKIQMLWYGVAPLSPGKLSKVPRTVISSQFEELVAVFAWCLSFCLEERERGNVTHECKIEYGPPV